MRTIRECPVVVVGGAGFLGSHLVNHLIDDRNCDVLVLDNLTSGRREFIHPKAKFEHTDVNGSEEQLRSLFYQYSIRYVFNYSSFPYVPDSYKRPLHVFGVNTSGALKAINAAQGAKCEGFLQVSSAEVYGEIPEAYWASHNGLIAEDAPVIPHSSYGASKAAIDFLTQTRWREAETKVLSLRQFNCAGERDYLHDYVIPEIVRQLLATSGRSPVKLGNNSYRDFMYAGDAVRMAVELLEGGEWGEYYNLGSQEGIQIYDLATAIGSSMGYDNVVVELDPSRVRKWEIWKLAADNSKIYSVVSSRPTKTLMETISTTVSDLVSAYQKGDWK